MDTYEIARARAQNIRNGLNDADVDTGAIIREAYKAKDWDAQGYDDWVSYVEAEFQLDGCAPHDEGVCTALSATIKDKLTVAKILGIGVPQATPSKERNRMAKKRLGKYQVARPLTSEELKSLEASVQENGILEAVIVDEDGNILDGHHRRHIADKLGIECPTRTMKGLSEDEKLSVAKELNFTRRHLNSEEKRQLIIDELVANPKLANRAIARQVGASEGTVRTLRKELETSAQITQTDTAVGKDGVERKKPKPEPVSQEPEFDSIDEAAEPVTEPAPTASLSALGELAEAVRRVQKAATYLGSDRAKELGLAALVEKLTSVSDAIG